jgi:uncharacterized protein
MPPVVDCHTHVFPPEVKRRRDIYCMMDAYFADLYEDPRSRIATVEDLLTEMDNSGVEISVLCGFGWSTSDLCAMHNDYMLDCISRYPDRLAALAAIQPRDGSRALSEVERCLEGGMKGVGELMPDGQGYSLDHLDTIGPLLEMAARHDFPIMTHTSEPVGHDYPGKQAVTPGILWTVVQAHPETKLIFSHWGGGYPFYELMSEVRLASRNVYYDSAASTYLYSQQVFMQVAQMAGYQKVLWGSDYPVLTQKRFLSKVRGLPLEREHREAILGGNTIRLLGLDDRAKPEGSDPDDLRSWAF